MDNITLAREAAKAAGEKKASRIIIQDLSQKSDMCEFQVICSGSSERQTQAIADAVAVHMKALGHSALAIEGKQSGHWILMDYGFVLIHIFLESVRDFYALENLWPDADLLPLEV